MLLQDRIAASNTVGGHINNFDGRTLEVRSAGEEAWLGRAAPPLNSPSLPDKVLAYNPGSQAVQLQASFRTIQDAVAAAKHGDRILLLKGVHNTMGEAIDIHKRILIQGEGALGETRIDQCANSPAFRIHHSCTIHNLEVDMTGFRECITMQCEATMHAVLDHCIISGDDAIDLGGKSSALLIDCKLHGAKCGLRAFGNAHGKFQLCSIKDCGEQGVKLMDSARLELERCDICACKEEGIVAMDRSAVHLTACRIVDCKGPALDLSARANANLIGCTLSDNAGGVWMWEDATVAATASTIQGGSCFAMLADGNATCALEHCDLVGNCQFSDRVWESLAGQVAVTESADRSDFPDHVPFTFGARLSKVSS